MANGLIAVAMSGGVDSSTVAAMLRAEGREIVGLTMQLWDQRRMPELIPEGGATGRCCSLDDAYDARLVAESLGAPFYVVNFEDKFEQEVVRPFVEDYLNGRTPIPCALCNNFVKFDRLLDMAAQVGAERIATGHYARIRFDAEAGRYLLLRGRDATRDQSYFLFGLTQAQLSRTLFPLGDMLKSQVRETARRLSVPVAEKGESREICFVPNGDYARFVETYLAPDGASQSDLGGELVTASGETLGGHAGVHRFTVGQRRGLGVAAGRPLYVTEIRPARRQVVVGDKRELLRRSFFADKVNWIAVPKLTAPRRVEVKIRYQFTPAPAEIRPTSRADRVAVEFESPQLAAAPGQAAVFYDGDSVVGGGWIERSDSPTV